MSEKSRDEFEFRSFDSKTLAATKKHWIEDAEKGLAFTSEVERLMDWVGTHMSPVEHDSAAFGVFRKGHNAAVGICEIVIQRKSVRSKWVKMLRLHLAPTVDAALQGGAPEDAMNVFKASLVGSMGLQMAHAATTMKVFGRTNEQLAFLRIVVESLQNYLRSKPNNPAKVAIEGRFLTISVN